MSSATEEVQEETPEFIKQDDVIDVVEEDEGTAALRATIEQINLENQNTEDKSPMRSVYFSALLKSTKYNGGAGQCDHQPNEDG